jgi:predicted porin
MNKYLPAFFIVYALSNQTSAQSLVTMYSGDIHFSDYDIGNANSRSSEMSAIINTSDREDMIDGMSAKFQLDSIVTMNNSAADQSGLLFGHQAQIGVSGNWGTLAMGRESKSFFYDNAALDPMSPGMTKNATDAFIGVSMPTVNHAFFASYSDQGKQVDSTTNTSVKQFSLAYTYPLSRMTNLFLARTRIDNPSSNDAPFSTLSGIGCRQFQLGLHHVF